MNNYIVIPVHNRKDTTLRCLSHLNDIYIFDKYKVVIIDDGSTDGTSEEISSKFPKCIILEGDGNLWWTGAICKGMEYAFSQGADHVVWLNDDCLPEEGTLDRLLESSNKCRSLAAPAIYHDHSNEPWSTAFVGRSKVDIQPNNIYFVDGISGYCVVVPRFIYDVIGLPDKDKFPHYAGDATYTLRASRAGYRICVDSSVGAKLIGKPGENHHLGCYIKVRSSMTEVFNTVFFTLKSPFYLQSRLSYYQYKYGAIFGSFIFSCKLTLWTGKILVLYTRKRFIK